MCSGNDSGNFVMPKTLCCDSLYRQNISTFEIHCQLMLVFGDCVLRPHRVGKGWIEFKSGLASIIKITLFRLAVQEHVNTVKWWNWFWKCHQGTIHDLSIALEWFVKTTRHCPCTTGIQQCVYMVGTKKCDGSSKKLMFAGALSLLQSFKGFPGSVVTLWNMG